MKKVCRGLFNVCILVIVGLLAGCQYNCNTPVFSFDVAADMREFANAEHLTPEYFRGVCLAILQTGKGVSMVSRNRKPRSRNAGGHGMAQEIWKGKVT